MTVSATPVRSTRAHPGRITAAVGALCAALLLGAAVEPPTSALADAPAGSETVETLTYEPYKLVHSTYAPDEVDGFLAQLDHFGVGQALLQTPAFEETGELRVPRRDLRMLAVWAAQAAAYNAAHGTDITVAAVFNGEVRTSGGGLDLDDPVTRETMLAGIEAVLRTGVSDVHLDLEPYPVTPGFLLLLADVEAAVARADPAGRLSVVAPGRASKWSPAYLHDVSQRVDQLNPLLYDSGFDDVAAYQDWIEESLRYYTAYAAPTAQIVPVIPSYSANRWHRPSVENVGTATAALADALAAGSRVNGAGIWWWFGFFYDEDGAYHAGADRDAWLSTTLQLPFSP